MSRVLLLSVRFQDGLYHGERRPNVGEWPPSPARLFQALISGTANGETLEEKDRRALEWLETLAPPAIAAPIAHLGQRFTNYVPNNDRDVVEGGSRSANKIRSEKTICPHLFDPKSPLLFIYTFEDQIQKSETHARIVCEIVERLYQIGRSVDLAWAWGELMDEIAIEARLTAYRGVVYRPDKRGKGTTIPCPERGSLASLQVRFRSPRFSYLGKGRKYTTVFNQPPKAHFRPITYDCPPHRLVFELRASDTAADFSGCPLDEVAELVQEVRDKAASRLCGKLPELADRVERYLIGRDARDSDKPSRIRIVPIPSVGSEYADLAIRRLAVYVPQSCPLAADDLAWAFAQVAWVDADGVIFKELQRADDDRMVRRFERRGRRWRSLTPLALPLARRRRVDPDRRSDQAKGAAERAAEEARAAAAVRQALRHAGTGAPVTEVRVQREPFHHRGDRAESFASGTRFTKDMLWHAEVTFTEPVAGPLLLGNGRFLGLGLMHPSEPMRGVLAFAITGGLSGNATSGTVATAARRAMMARVQRDLRRGERFPAYVSGHEEDGSPAGGGAHRHIAVVADLPRGRLLYIAPTWLQRRGIRWREIEQDHRRTAQALEGMDVLRAGAAGRLTLVPSVLDPECDPLFAPARVWESVTDYHVTRHHRRLSDEEALKTDIASELDRRGWPLLRPDAIEVIAVQRGPRGRLSGRLRLTFPAAQRGPLLTGRTSHKGGGLFSGV